MTCSDSGLTPSSSAARRTRSRTSAACSAGSGPLTRTCARSGSPAGSPIGMRHCREAELVCGVHRVNVVVRCQILAAGAVRETIGAVRAGAGLDWHEPVANVADRADQRLVLRAELGSEPPDVDIDCPGATEVVVAPYLLEQLRPGEYAPRMLGQELQQLELLEGQVEGAAVHPGRVGRLVHD